MTPHDPTGDLARASTRRTWTWALLAGLLALLAAGSAIDVRATYGARTSADEPHYLLTAISLAEDGDLDVADELDDERWRAFHEAQLPIQELELEDGRMLAPHDPLLPLLLAGPWAIAGTSGAKGALAVLAGALAVATVWTASRRFATSPAVAGLVTIAVMCAWPLAGYGTQVYPELPAALVVVLAAAVGTRAGPPRVRELVAVVALVTALPWLAVKYVPVAGAITAVLIVRWWRSGHRRAATTTVLLLAATGVAYLALHQLWYGGWTVYAAADHFVERGEFAVIGFDPQPLGRARRLVGLLVDQDFGIAAWQPLWLLAVPAVAVLVARRPRGWALLAWPLLAGWLTAAFVALTMQGWWVPGRQVVVVLPLAAIALAMWLDDAPRGWRIGAVLLGATGIASYVALVRDGLAGRLTWIVDFATVDDPLYRARRVVLPDYLDITASTWALQAAWIAVFAVLAIVAVWAAGTRTADDPRDAERGNDTPDRHDDRDEVTVSR